MSKLHRGFVGLFIYARFVVGYEYTEHKRKVLYFELTSQKALYPGFVLALYSLLLFYPNLQFQYLLVSISILFLWLQIFCKLGSFAASALVIPLVHYVCVYLNRRYHISVKFLHRLTAGQVVMIVSAALYMITTHSYNYGETFYMIILVEIHMTNKAYQKVSHTACSVNGSIYNVLWFWLRNSGISCWKLLYENVVNMPYWFYGLFSCRSKFYLSLSMYWCCVWYEPYEPFVMCCCLQFCQ